MFEKIKDMIADQLGVDADSITEETSFKDDLGADSLDLFELIMALEDEYGVSIPTEELEKLTTVGSVIAYLKNNGVAECKLIAQSEVAVLLWQIVVETHTLFFKSYKQLCGVDFSKDFAYADMKTCRDKWLLITEELSKSARGLNFSDNLRCRNAWADLKAEIDRTEFFDDAAAGALNVNPRIYEKYVA